MSTPMIVMATALGILALLYFAAQTFLQEVKKRDAIILRKQEAFDKLSEEYAEVRTTDELTGCINQRYFLELLSQQISLSRRGNFNFAVVVTRINQLANLQQENNNSGGNVLLQEFARIGKATLRNVDVFARLDDNSFALVLTGCDANGAHLILTRLAQKSSEIFLSDDIDPISLSYGIAMVEADDSAEGLLEHAKEALSSAHNEGDSHVYVSKADKKNSQSESDRQHREERRQL